MGQKATIKAAKQRLLNTLATLDPGTTEYAKVNAELERMTKSQANENSWLWPNVFSVINTVATCVTSGIQVSAVLKHEDRGNVVTTKSLGYAQKLPNPNNGPKK